MQYEIIATVRLVIIAEILGLIAAELRRSVQICNFSRHSSRKRSTTRQLLDIARSLAVPRQDGGKQVLFETSYGVRRYLEPSLRCFSLDAPLPHTNPHTNGSAPGGSRTAGLGGACAHLTRAQCAVGQPRTPCACQVGAGSPLPHAPGHTMGAHQAYYG